MRFTVKINPWGELVTTSGGYFDLSDKAMLQEIIQLAQASKEQIGVLKDYNLRFRKNSGPFEESIVFVDISSELSTMKSLVKSCVFIGILSFTVFLGISFLLARWAVKPVDKAWNQQRQFVADASHELKTPLTVIITNAELLQSPDYGEAERRRFADSIMTMSQQMRGLVESLLELTRVDNGTAKMVFSELDILLDNAAKYSFPNGCVDVSLQRQGNHCLLAVSNPGEEISKEDLKNIFKRFYRIDKARSMNHSYGLGLSIAESIIKEHCGKIWAESGSGINTFFVQLPTI